MYRKRKNLFALVLIPIWLLVVSCGLGQSVKSRSASEPAPQAGASPGVSTLWPDVPVFADANPDQEANTFLHQVPSDKMSTFVYYTSKRPADVVAFYTDDLMKTQGWSPQPYNIVDRFSDEGFSEPSTGSTPGGCALGADQGQPAAVCTFSKQDDQGRLVALTIDISMDEKTSQTKINYVRMTGSSAKK